MSHRKQILVSTSVASKPDKDEIAREPENVEDACAMCGKKTTGKNNELWIQCDRYLNFYYYFSTTIKRLRMLSLSKCMLQMKQYALLFLEMFTFKYRL